MTLSDLNAKIDATCEDKYHRLELWYRRDERLGILGVHAGQEPTEEQVQIVHDQLFPIVLTP